MKVYLLQHVTDIPHDVGCHGTSFRLLRLANAAPTCSLLDLARIALDPDLLKEMNPFLKAVPREQLHDGVIVWLQLCVLEDRLTRLIGLAEHGEEQLPVLIQVFSYLMMLGSVA